MRIHLSQRSHHDDIADALLNCIKNMQAFGGKKEKEENIRDVEVKIVDEETETKLLNEPKSNEN